MSRVNIIGAGLAGCLLANYLGRKGYRVHVYERRPDPRVAGYAGGRSINLALSARGLWGLAGVELDEVVLASDATRMPGRMLHDPQGRTSFHPYSANPADAINSVSRGDLNLTLLRAAVALPGVSFEFDHRCLAVDMDLDRPCAVMHGNRGVFPSQADAIFGADGAFSPVRGSLQKTDRFEYSQSYLAHGYKELHIPARTDGTHAMDPNALHIWPRGGSMMIALPNRDRSFTCTLFWPFEGPHSFAAVTPGNALDFFREHYPDAVPLMPTLAPDFAANPVGSLVTVRCAPWHVGRVAIIGDAAHAIVPFYGQGMNAAFEDVRLFSETVPSANADWPALFARFEASRRPDTDAIAEMAVDNFTEMRDLSARPEFQYRKRIERALHTELGELMTPQYNLVSFTTTPYRDARARGRAIAAVIDAVAAGVPASVDLAADEWSRRVTAAGRAALANPDAHGRALIDISPRLTPTTNVWPGDTPITREVLADLAKGDTVTLSTMRSTVHLGAHADGPNHYGLHQPAVGDMPLHHYIGPCRVLHAAVARGERVEPRHIAGLDTLAEARVLIKTGTFPDVHHWNADFAALSVELIDVLAARGVITIGIDTPSVDLQTSKDVPAHKAILRHGVAILEGLDLAAVAPGRYELIAAPLRLADFDASPVRALLRSM